MATIQKNRFKNIGFLSTYITYSNCLILVFFILSFIGILNHELWRDETQAWLIARDATTLTDLYKNLKYEGHPGLWHFCLFLITKFTHNPFAMQFFHILIATAIVYIFVKLSPFNIVQKTLFTFGYFPLFEYNLISRNYSLGLLLVFIFCYLFTRKSRNYIALFSTLALLANTNVYSSIICLCCSAVLIIDTIKNRSQLNRKQIKSFYIGLAILVFGLSLMLFQLVPIAIEDTAKDIQQNVGGAIPQASVSTAPTSKFNLIFVLFKRFISALRTVWFSHAPIPNFFKYHFWNHDITSAFRLGRLFSVFMSVFLVFFAVFLFIEKPIVLLLYSSGTLGLIFFMWLKFQGNLRHHGNLFILFLACIWISKYLRKSSDVPKPLQRISKFCQKFQGKILTVLLLIQMLSGIYAYSMDLIYPFSRSKVAAEFIQKQGLSQEFILGYEQRVISPISAYLDKQIFYLEYGSLGSFFNNHQRKYLKDDLKQIELINSAIKDNSTKNVLILSSPLDIKTDRLKITQIGAFNNSILAEERYYIYLVENN